MTKEMHGIMVKLGMKALLMLDAQELAALAGEHSWVQKKHALRVLEAPFWQDEERPIDLLERALSRLPRTEVLIDALETIGKGRVVQKPDGTSEIEDIEDPSEVAIKALADYRKEV